MGWLFWHHPNDGEALSSGSHENLSRWLSVCLHNPGKCAEIVNATHVRKCYFQTDYYKILNEELTNQRRFEDDNGKTVLVTEPDTSGKVGHKVIRGTPERLLSQLIDANSTTADPSYVEDFLLTHRTFMDSSLIVIEKLLEWFIEGKHCDRVTRVLLLWVRRSWASRNCVIMTPIGTHRFIIISPTLKWILEWWSTLKSLNELWRPNRWKVIFECCTWLVQRR